MSVVGLQFVIACKVFNLETSCMDEGWIKKTIKVSNDQSSRSGWHTPLHPLFECVSFQVSVIEPFMSPSKKAWHIASCACQLICQSIGLQHLVYHQCLTPSTTSLVYWYTSICRWSLSLCRSVVQGQDYFGLCYHWWVWAFHKEILFLVHMHINFMKLKLNFIHFSCATGADAEPDPRNPGQAAGHAAYDAEPAARCHTGGALCRGEIAAGRHEKLHTHTKGIHGRP